MLELQQSKYEKFFIILLTLLWNLDLFLKRTDGLVLIRNKWKELPAIGSHSKNMTENLSV